MREGESKVQKVCACGAAAHAGDDDGGFEEDDVLAVVLPDGRVQSAVHGLEILGISYLWNGCMGE